MLSHQRRAWPAATVMIILTLGAAGCAQTVAPFPGPPGSAGASPAGSVGPADTGPGSAATESNPPGDIPDNQAFVRFTPAGVAVTIKVPEGWARSTVGATTLFTDKLNRIEINTAAARTAPTVQTVTGEVVPKLQASVPQFALGRVSEEKRAGTGVVLLTYQGDSAADPVTGKVVRDAFERYAYFHNGHLFSLTLSGPTNADNVDPWRIVSDSVTWS